MDYLKRLFGIFYNDGDDFEIDLLELIYDENFSKSVYDNIYYFLELKVFVIFYKMKCKFYCNIGRLVVSDENCKMS